MSHLSGCPEVSSACKKGITFSLTTKGLLLTNRAIYIEVRLHPTTCPIFMNSQHTLIGQLNFLHFNWLKNLTEEPIASYCKNVSTIETSDGWFMHYSYVP